MSSVPPELCRGLRWGWGCSSVYSGASVLRGPSRSKVTPSLYSVGALHLGEGKQRAQGHMASSSQSWALSAQLVSPKRQRHRPRSGQGAADVSTTAPRTVVKVKSPAPGFKPIWGALAQGRGRGVANGFQSPALYWAVSLAARGQGRRLSKHFLSQRGLSIWPSLLPMY